MLVLGLIDSKPSTAALLDDGKIVAAISEERLVRLKQATGMPRRAISAVMEVAGVKAGDIDAVAVAQNALTFEPESKPWPGWFQEDHSTSFKKRLLAQVSGTLAPAVGSMPAAWSAHHTFKSLLNRDRLTKLPRLLEEAYNLRAPVQFFDHHLCHAASAYYTSNFDETLVITLDGGGDGRSGSVYMAADGRLQPLGGVDSFNSIGNLYSYVTALCGFKAEKHEGKITGLAAFGEPLYLDILRQFIEYREPGNMRYKIPMYHQSALQRLGERLPKDFDRAALAASMQTLLEEIGLRFVRYWLQKTGANRLAVAGGVFSNVKFNQRVHELDEVEAFFVHPAMDDSGLSVGAAFVAAAARHPRPVELIQHLPNVYFGPSYSDVEIEQAIGASGFKGQYQPNMAAKIAELLAQGAVVARFTGRMEYGPRALGHRSIMYQAADPSINDWLNHNLKRTEFMPFAPATLVERADAYYEGLDGARDPARFMTITFQCTEKMRDESPGVVHVDGTARPQLVDRETAPDFYSILTEYDKLTGIPTLINTSFNMHEEPIVCSPADALRSFDQGNLDYLAVGNWLLAHPRADELRASREAASAAAVNA